MAIAQNGPGVTGFVTAMKTAYWNHTRCCWSRRRRPTRRSARAVPGSGTAQSVQGHGLLPGRGARSVPRGEVLNRVIEKAWRGCAPAQINVPRDYWTHVIDIELPQIVRLERPRWASGHRRRGGDLSGAKFPVILAGAGVVIGDAVRETAALAERLDAPVCSGYQHNDSFPGSHPLAVGPLGYNGSKAAMELIAKADWCWPSALASTHSRPCRLRHRLLAEAGQDHSGRHQPRSHRPHEADHGRHLRRRAAGRPATPGAGGPRRPEMRAARSARR